MVTSNQWNIVEQFVHRKIRWLSIEKNTWRHVHGNVPVGKTTQKPLKPQLPSGYD
jgi:hypothetical protein